MIFYHGTRAPFRGRGGLVVPGADVGKDNHNLSRSDVVYVTTDLELAWAYADCCAGKGKPRVLVVTPQSGLGVDDSTVGGGEQDSYTCTHARVEKVLTVQPVTNAYSA